MINNTKMESLLKTKQDKEEFLTWIAWLIAGVLPQGKGSLEDTKGYCCLGAACIILVPEEKLEIYTQDEIVGREYVGKLKGGMPSWEDVPIWLNNLDSHMSIKKGYGPVNLNDSQEKTFPEIGEIVYEAYEDELMAIPD